MNAKILTTITFLLLTFLSVPLFAQLTISGTIARDGGEPVEGLVVEATNLSSTITDASGYYEFDAPAGYTGDITPISPLDYPNGVTVFDSLLVRAHILAQINLNNPYKLIAADVSNNDIVSTLDLLHLSNVANGQELVFPNSDSWRYYNADNVYPNPNNPGENPTIIPLSVDNLSADATIDMVAVKIGDVDYSATEGYSLIVGTIFSDDNENCLDDDDSNSPITDGWNIELEGMTSYIQVVDEIGNFVVIAPEGDYNLIATPPNTYWQSCQTSYPITVTQDTPIDLAIGAQKVVDCPFMEVNMNAPFLRRCFENNYRVDYCNYGTAVAEDASVTVHFDPFLTVISTSLAPTSVDGNIYTFDLGDVGVGACSSILAVVEVSCDAELGQTHCTEANIFPNQLCEVVSPLYSGANLILTGECQDEKVKFTIENIGDDMIEAVDYIIIEDLLVKMQDEVQLNSGEKWEMESDNFGTTCRLEVEQIANHPLGHQLIAFVEGCGTHPDGSISLGMITQFAFDGNKPFSDVDCIENGGSFDPNDIMGFPLGYGEENIIDRGQSLDYKIRFQNTGTDTAFTVRIENPLPIGMDWATLRPLNSSHDYEWTVEGDKLVFNFYDIMLADSNINEAASHGYVRYSLDQQADLEIGDIIENQASIFFDFNEPVITNVSTHTIGEDLMTVEATEVFLPNVGINFFPNPFDNQLTIDLETEDFQTGQLEIYDAVGKMVHVETFYNHALTINTEHLRGGLYFFYVKMNGQAAASGKIVKN